MRLLRLKPESNRSNLRIAKTCKREKNINIQLTGSATRGRRRWAAVIGSPQGNDTKFPLSDRSGRLESHFFSEAATATIHSLRADRDSNLENDQNVVFGTTITKVIPKNFNWTRSTTIPVENRWLQPYNMCKFHVSPITWKNLEGRMKENLKQCDTCCVEFVVHRSNFRRSQGTFLSPFSQNASGG